jgi:hypothetical protein
MDESNNEVFSTLDISHGDSGSGIWFRDEEDSLGPQYHVFAVTDTFFQWSAVLGYKKGYADSFAEINDTRHALIKTIMKKDGDEPSWVLSHM